MITLIQYRSAAGLRGVAAIRDRAAPVPVTGASSIRELALRACRAGVSLTALVEAGTGAEPLDLAAVQLLAPIDHEDPAHLLLSGTGLTHMGSAEERDRMHRAITDAPRQSDSMKMFLMGMQGGKPSPDKTGVQPEWFFKGDGTCLVAPGAPLCSPQFALDAGEEPEIAGIYLIADNGQPMRLGYALANEFSDHVTERHNYLWLAHSKLRPAALGPELLLGELPMHVEGLSRILRDGEVIWEKPFLTGEDNMSHSLRNLEQHHFKYANFRRPGDVHVHFFGTGTLSYSDEVRTREGDVFEISAPPFSLPVRNPIGSRTTPDIAVGVL
jgi:hypothetical protein